MSPLRVEVFDSTNGTTRIIDVSEKRWEEEVAPGIGAKWGEWSGLELSLDERVSSVYVEGFDINFPEHFGSQRIELSFSRAILGKEALTVYLKNGIGGVDFFPVED